MNVHTTLRLVRGLMLAAALLFVAAPGRSQTPENLSTVGVLKFQVDGLSESAAEALAHTVRRVLLENPQLTLIERDRMEAIFQEQGYQLSGACYDVSCLVEAGRILGAQRIVTGSVNRLGRKYIVELRAANVVNGRIEALETIDHRGPVEDLTEPTRTLARRLVARLANRPGVITVLSRPQASTVTINGEAVGFAPVTVTRPGGVEYTVEVNRPGYERERRAFTLAEGDTMRLSLTLGKREESGPILDDPSFRVFAGAGFPLDQGGASLDRNLSLGNGESFGGMLQFGTDWRMNFGAFSYYGKVRDVDDNLWRDYGASGAPIGDAFVTFASLALFLGAGDGFAPFIGAGVSSMQREVTLPVDGQRDHSQLSEYEIGGLFQLGVEIEITSWISTQVGLLHATSFASDRTWWSEVEEPHEVWTRSFTNFESFTVFMLQVGLTL